MKMATAHHAYVYYAQDLSVLPEAWQTPSLDVTHYTRDRWLVSDTRTLIADVQLRPVEASSRVFIIHFSHATTPSQNALLKLLEEAPSNVELHLVVPHKNALLPTVRSRLLEVGVNNTNKNNDHAPKTTNNWNVFLSLSAAERLAVIAKHHATADANWLEEIGVAATRYERVPRPARQLLDQYFQLPGASRKLLLEEVVLSLATFKQ